MPNSNQPKGPAIDLTLLAKASTRLLGYFVHRWFRLYLVMITNSLRDLFVKGLIDGLDRPTPQGRRVLFDFGALDAEKLRYLIGYYTYVMSCHKGANYRLMHRYDGKQVFYLRGYDLDMSVPSGEMTRGEGLAVGASTMHTQTFGWKLQDLIGEDVRLFRVLSPKDVYWDTIGLAHRYFHGDFDGVVRSAMSQAGSVYLNAQHWQEGVLDLLDRMDHYVVYASSITPSLLWELAQLDTDERRGRVTVVFDEEAIDRGEEHVAMQARLEAQYGERVIWTKDVNAPLENVQEFRARLGERFVVTTPEDFEAHIEHHLARIMEGSARVAPGERETWLDFDFRPALDEPELQQLQSFSVEMRRLIDTAVATEVECLPLLLAQVQLRIYATLLFGEHDLTGEALGHYGGIMRAALDYYEPEGKIGAISARNRESHLDMLRENLHLAEHAGPALLAFGRSHEFDDYPNTASERFDAAFEVSRSAAGRFFAKRGGPLPAE